MTPSPRSRSGSNSDDAPFYQTIHVNPEQEAAAAGREYLVRQGKNGEMVLVEKRLVVHEQPLSHYSDTNPELFEAHLAGVVRAIAKQPKGTAKSVFALIGLICTILVLGFLVVRGITASDAPAAAKGKNAGESSIWFR